LLCGHSPNQYAQRPDVAHTSDQAASLVRVELLIIDDFGLKPLRRPADEDLRELVPERYEAASTIVTRNLYLTEWVKAVFLFSCERAGTLTESSVFPGFRGIDRTGAVVEWGLRAEWPASPARQTWKLSGSRISSPSLNIKAFRGQQSSAM
jgi:hypothetical protein